MDTDKELKAAIEKVAKAKVAEALGGDVLGKLVESVMNHKQRTAYGGHKTDKTAFETIVEDAITATISRAVREVIAEDTAAQERIRKLIREQADRISVSVIDAFKADDCRIELNVRLGEDG